MKSNKEIALERRLRRAHLHGPYRDLPVEGRAFGPEAERPGHGGFAAHPCAHWRLRRQWASRRRFAAPLPLTRQK